LQDGQDRIIALTLNTLALRLASATMRHRGNLTANQSLFIATRAPKRLVPRREPCDWRAMFAIPYLSLHGVPRRSAIR
jgi:hypothetical protein